MKNISLKYDPYRVEMKFLENGEPSEKFNQVFAENTELGAVDDFFGKIYEVTRGDFTLEFSGLERDYNFLEDALKLYKKTNQANNIILEKGNVSVAGGVQVEKLRELFKKLDKLPYKALKSDSVKRSFNKALDNEFEIAVMATMSSGKSTLINAIVGHDILPTGSLETTARIARIHDKKNMNHFECCAYDETRINDVIRPFDEKGRIKFVDNLTLSEMEDLNKDKEKDEAGKEISVIEIFGKVEGIDTKNLQLVLSDTPGVNKTDKYADRTKNLLKAEYKPMVLIVLDANNLGVNDSNKFLKWLSDAMEDGSRQTKDRFIFVLNKIDAVKPANNEGVEKALSQAREFLLKFNIKEPKIFPCSSRLAQMIRKKEAKEVLSDDEEDDIENVITKFIKRDYFHLSDKAMVSPYVRNKLDAMIEDAKDDKEKLALIYSGIPAIELTISEYLDVYALPAKIRQAVEVFNGKVKKEKIKETTKKDISQNKEKIESLRKGIKTLQEKLNKGDKAKELKQKVESLSIDNEWKEAVIDATNFFDKKKGEFYNDLPEKIDVSDGTKKEAASQKINTAFENLMDIIDDFLRKIQSSVKTIINNQASRCVKDYETYLKTLIGGTFDINTFNVENLFGSEIDISVSELLIDLDDENDMKNYSCKEVVGTHLEKIGSHKEKIGEKEAKIGEKWIENTDKKWWKFWTWFDEDGHFEDIFETQDVFKEVDDFKTVNDYGSFIYPKKAFSSKISTLTEKLTEKSSTKGKCAVDANVDVLKKAFLKKFDELTDLIKKLSEEINKKTENTDELSKMNREAEENLKKLEEFQKELDSVLNFHL